ncbi:MAG: prepilin-type N-terminal cleavage/methylation domain-containing protein [Candidatus Omnitrophica bacterium]|nr:prepilin-type N-terminal cleavage/methylation domain-containing protein [Candidatus Omnitrophota bacterium]
MIGKKGFTLIEILVATIIIGVLTAIILPSYTANILQGEANAAQNNLITIYGAQKTFYYNNGAYCFGTFPNNCSTLANINGNLKTQITDAYFNYTCSNVTGFTCTATNTSDNTFVLAVRNAAIVKNNNPSCAYPAHPTYCPN